MRNSILDKCSKKEHVIASKHKIYSMLFAKEASSNIFFHIQRRS